MAKLPKVQNTEWAQHALDYFILKGLEKVGLDPAPRAARPVSIRRAYMDLIGLLPTPEEVDAFVRDNSPNAFAKVIDILLASRLTATGFLALGTKILAKQDPVKKQADIVDEQIDTIGRSLMGLTLACARCHDHKFDPISHAHFGISCASSAGSVSKFLWLWRSHRTVV